MVTVPKARVPSVRGVTGPLRNCDPSKYVLLKDVIWEIEKISFPVITGKEYPPAWWGFGMGLEIRLQINKNQDRLCETVMALPTITRETKNYGNDG